MPKKVLFLMIGLLWLGSLSFAFAQEEKLNIFEVKVENKDASALTEEFSFSKNDLISEKINIIGQAKSSEANISKVEISTDGGRTWQEAEGTDTWQFRFYPDEGLYKIKFLVSDTKGNMQTLGDLKILYTKFKPEEAIFSLLKKIKESYEEENLAKFMDCFSESRYPNYTKFKEAIIRDFQYFRNIRMFKRVERYNISSDQKEAFYDVLWKSKYTDTRDNSKFSRSTIISMYFIKEDGLWKVASMKNNNIFGTILLSDIDLTLSSSDISSSGGAAPTITAAIRNNGEEEARNVKVKFYYRLVGGSFISFAERTISSISRKGSSSTSATLTGIQGNNITIKVDIDPDNTIAERNETNNSATITTNIPGSL
jgi:hypothetical protein